MVLQTRKLGSKTPQKTTLQETKCIILKKAELTFNDFSLSIEGNVSSSKLLEIVKILDRSC